MLYPRTIEVHRNRTVAGTGSTAIGLVGYSGLEQGASDTSNGEVVLFSGVPASIQAGSMGSKRMTSLPSDATSNPLWTIYIPVGAVPEGSIQDRDIVVDDRSYRYQVMQNYWNILGHKLTCVRLEA